MLLAHPWIKALSKPETIAEDAEAEAAAEAGDGAVSALADATRSLCLDNPSDLAGAGDYEVAEWVRAALERKSKGLLPRDGDEQPRRPALHAAPLDSVSPVASPLAGM